VTFNIDPAKIEEAITDKTKAILPVHLYGQMADMDPIVEIASKHGLAIIEDAAQAIGAKYKGKNVGELGTAATYSFFPTKNLGAYGDGGMIVTNDDEIAEKCRVIRVHGSKPKYYHHVLGYNSRLDEMQAAILNVKFPHLNEWSELRRERAATYTHLLKEMVGDAIVTPVEAEDRYHVFHQYTIRVPKRDELQAFLKEQGVATMVYYPLPLHLQPVFKELGYQEGDLPDAEKAAKEAVSLPMFPELKVEQQEYVVSKIAEFYKK
jgi:dTDP-4-amino-4,6-dideoxygalactose transaminase